jgi:hypothetical protein
MAWSGSAGSSGLYVATVIAGLTAQAQTGTPSAINIGSYANQSISLLLGTVTNYATPVNYGAASPAWVNTFECTGTGWATGGVALTGNGVTAAPSTITGSGPFVLTYTWTGALSVASTTLSGIYGAIVYFPSISAGLCSKPCLLGLCFGTTAYNTVAGTFGITPSGTGLAALTLTA